MTQNKPRILVWFIVAACLAIQAFEFGYIVHRESLTFDEANHMFAGYMMWKTRDFGLNPEHPPLVKLLATVPLLHQDLWVPPLQGREFKQEAYLDGRDWLARNDGSSQRLVFRMRVSAGLLALALSVTVFLAGREWFGAGAGMIALVLVTFDPNILAHSALVTTDVAVSLFFLAAVYAFYRYATRPGWRWGRLMLAGVVAGLLLATKHSGILLAPMLILLAGWEIAHAPKGERSIALRRYAGALACIVIVSLAVLWIFYGFRYSARPAPLELNPALAEYSARLGPVSGALVRGVVRAHLLPESYLMGLVDVKRMAEFYPTYIFGKVYAHGKWWYFPIVILIKTTLGMLALVALAFFAMVSGKLRHGRELAYIFIPWLVYLIVAMAAGMNIGARHILPLYAFAAIFAAGGVVTLCSGSSGRWRWAWCTICALLILAHLVSALAVFPNDLAYANETWGGPENVHRLLSDANVDWAQQLLQVKGWRDRHPDGECWFAYFAYPEIDPNVYGIHCHAMPTADTGWLGGGEILPPAIHGTVLISAGDLSGCEWPSALLNPYRGFQNRTPEEVIDQGVFVYQGDFAVPEAASLSRSQRARELLFQNDPEQALVLAREAVSMDPNSVVAQTALGNAAAAAAKKQKPAQAGPSP
jgi:4-amino-4-deoxy-L-arabinose transferase-like glycosyltransferase